jgi:hypothetical protein
MPHPKPFTRSAFLIKGFTLDETVEHHPESCSTLFQTSSPAPPRHRSAAG